MILLCIVVCSLAVITEANRDPFSTSFGPSQCMKDAADYAGTVFRLQAQHARSSRPHKDPQSKVKGSSRLAKQIGMTAFQQLECLKIIGQREKFTKNDWPAIFRQLPSLLTPNNNMAGPDMMQPRPMMGVCPYPSNRQGNHCRRNDKYRTYDGSCNNLQHPLWGKSMRALDRMLDPDYGDGIGTPRQASSGNMLPSARKVSLSLFEDYSHPSKFHTLMFMTFGQILAHDVMKTPVSQFSTSESGDGDLIPVDCGVDGCDTPGSPESMPCFPIPVEPNDPDFPGRQCLRFVRSQEGLPDDCVPSPREQMNLITSYLDASFVYGSSKAEAKSLRDSDKKRGKLDASKHPFSPNYKDLLPKDFVETTCSNTNSIIKCFKAGDARVNENSALAALHTVFQREHNRIEETLHNINSNWNGEKLFQESRKILGAAWQYIVYNEYLPIVLGPSIMSRYGLNLMPSGWFWVIANKNSKFRNRFLNYLFNDTKPLYIGYDVNVNADNLNGFSTAAFRFGHSQIAKTSYFAGRPWWQIFVKRDLSTELFSPSSIYNGPISGISGVDSLILGQVLQAAEGSDLHFTKQVTAKLFSPNPPHAPGTDLPALNVQRGRDHGIPGYNAWRTKCGLSKATSFQNMQDIPANVRVKFMQLYEHVDDVDLYAAGLAETHVPGGVVGPTFACIIAKQFQNLRVGDRFWHERFDTRTGFTYAQLQEIRKFTLARLICDNLDQVNFSIQPYAMLQPFSSGMTWPDVYHQHLGRFYRPGNNARKLCNLIPRPDLNAWKKN